MVGESDPKGNLNGPVHEFVAHHQEWQKLRQHHIRLGPNNHGVCRANPIHFGHGQLSLVGAAASKNDVTFAEAQLRPNDIAAFAPAPDVQILWIQMLQSHIDFFGRISRFDTLIDAVRKCSEWHSFPSLTVKEWPFGPVGVHR